jgi:hypothetical protein
MNENKKMTITVTLPEGIENANGRIYECEVTPPSNNYSFVNPEDTELPVLKISNISDLPIHQVLIDWQTTVESMYPRAYMELDIASPYKDSVCHYMIYDKINKISVTGTMDQLKAYFKYQGQILNFDNGEINTSNNLIKMFNNIRYPLSFKKINKRKGRR